MTPSPPGGMSYDDPIETTVIDASECTLPGTTCHPRRLYLVFDEAGAGNLQVVVNSEAQIVARSITNDPYGAEQLELAGAAVDRVTVNAKKDSAGNLAEVHVAIRSTELLAAPTIAAGGRLAVVDSDGHLVRTASVTPNAVASDAFSLEWVLTPSQWNALIDLTPAVVGSETRVPIALSVAVTKDLRAAVWALDVPVLPAPDWTVAAKRAYTGDLPVEVREQLSSLAELVTHVPNGGESTSTLYEVEGLSLLGSPSGTGSNIEDLLSATFQAQPFAEPVTRKNYVRSRWLDPATGTWLSPDPVGYEDSSNLYAFCGGDPVNCIDSTGMWGWKDAWETTKSVGGLVVGVVESAAETVNNLNPVVSTVKTAVGAYQRGKRISAAYRSGGVSATAKQYGAEVKDYTVGVAKGLPIVHTIIEGSKVIDAYDTLGSFEGGRQLGRTAFSAAGDAALIYGGVRGVQQMRAGRPMYHYTTAEGEAGILKDRNINASPPAEYLSVNEAGIHDRGALNPQIQMGNRSFTRNVFFTDVPPERMTASLREELAIQHMDRALAIREQYIRSQAPFYQNPTHPNIFNAVADQIMVPPAIRWELYGLLFASRGQADQNR